MNSPRGSRDKEKPAVVPYSAPIKTPEGQAELATRARRVSQRHRTLLFLVDGRRSETELKQLAEAAGVPASCYDELLHMGLIVRPQASLPLPPPSPADDEVALHIDLPLTQSPPDDGIAAESLLPASKPMSVESTLHGDLGPAEPWRSAELGEPADGESGQLDVALAEARDMLLRAVRSEAPVAGSLTLMRLRRAATRAELEALLDEVEARLRKPHRMLATTLLMRRVRQLLGIAADSSMSV